MSVSDKFKTIRKVNNIANVPVTLELIPVADEKINHTKIHIVKNNANKFNYKITYQKFGSPEIYTKLFENVPYEFMKNISFFKLEKL